MASLEAPIVDIVFVMFGLDVLARLSTWGFTWLRRFNDMWDAHDADDEEDKSDGKHP